MRATESSIRDNLARVRERIEAACQRAGRAADEVRLLAVTKKQAAERIRQAYDAGQRLFGENQVQEFESKQVQLPLPGAEWHLIGHLQSNKTRRAAALFDVVESVHSVKLARRLNEAADSENSKVLTVFIEVKLSGEASKSGCAESELEAIAAEVAALPHLHLRGLMTVPPFTEDPEGARPFFRRLRQWRDKLRLPELSMGMSHDFEAAIEEGATLVRVGTAIFGERRSVESLNQ